MPITSRDIDAVTWGVADVWVAPVDTAIPTSTTTLTEPTDPTWIPMGFTAEGVQWSTTITKERIPAGEETIAAAGWAVTEMDSSISFSLTEDTIENLQLALGVGTVTMTAAAAGQIGKKVLVLGETLIERAVAVMADNGKGFKDLIYIPRCMSGGEVSKSFRRAARRELAVTLAAACEPEDIQVVQQFAAATV